MNDYHFRRFLLSVTLFISGCGAGADGPTRYELEGRISLNGRPVPAGEIHFDPDTSQGNGGPGGVATIEDGRYRTVSGRGTVGGPHVARINAYDGKPPEGAEAELYPHGMPLIVNHQESVHIPHESGTYDFEIVVPE